MHPYQLLQSCLFQDAPADFTSFFCLNSLLQSLGVPLSGDLAQVDQLLQLPQDSTASLAVLNRVVHRSRPVPDLLRWSSRSSSWVLWREWILGSLIKWSETVQFG